MTKCSCVLFTKSGMSIGVWKSNTYVKWSGANHISVINIPTVGAKQFPHPFQISHNCSHEYWLTGWNLSVCLQIHYSPSKSIFIRSYCSHFQD